MEESMPLTKYNLYSPHHEGTLYFNHVTQEFTPGPTPLEDRRSHASGTITDQETGERIVVIAGGKNSNHLDTTELLFNGEWHAGKNQHTLDPRITFFKILIFLLNQDQHYQPFWFIMQ